VSARVSIDTGVFIDYIDIKSSFHKLARALVDSLNRMEVFLPGVILAETCYVAARIYKTLGFSNFLEKALKIVEWLNGHPSIHIDRSFNLDIEAAKIKTQYNVALTDCYLLAISKIRNSTVVFRKREKEMPLHLEKDFKILFLEDYA